MIYQMTDQEIADKIPEGYYRVDAGVRKEGDLVLYADLQRDDFDPVKGLGAEIRHGAVIARPMLKPSNQHDTHPQDKAKTDDKGKPPLAKVYSSTGTLNTGTTIISRKAWRSAGTFPAPFGISTSSRTVKTWTKKAPRAI